MESFHTQTERLDTGNRGVFNSPGAAAVGINLGQWHSAHGGVGLWGKLGLSLTPFTKLTYSLLTSYVVYCKIT